MRQFQGRGFPKFFVRPTIIIPRMMGEMKCDVLVVGIGPVGSAVAFNTAKDGMDVIAIDRKFQVASPLRGGEAVCKPFYDDLVERMPVLRKVPKNKTEGTSLEAGKCKLISKEEKWQAYVLERKNLEKILAEKASESGANLLFCSELIKVNKRKGVFDEAIVRTIDGKCRIRPKIIVAADGFASFFRKQLGLNKPNKDWASAVEFEMVNINFTEPDLLEVFFTETIPGGYSYIFPKFGRRGLAGVAMRPQFDGNLSPLDIFNHLAKNYTTMSIQLKDARVLEVRGGCIDVSGPFKEPVYNNVVLVGDSANQNFAYIGEGIVPGLFAALSASRKIVKAVEENNLRILAEYPKDYRNTYLWKELMQTWRIKENIDDLLQKQIKTDIKLAIMSFLELEVIDWTGKELPDALKIKSFDKLLRFGQELVESKGMSIDITPL